MNFPWEQLRPTAHTVFHVKERSYWELPYRQNPFAALWYILKGDATVSTKDVSYPAGPGTILILPPSIPFKAQISGKSDFVRILVVRFSLYSGEHMDWLRLYRLPTILSSEKTNLTKKDFLRLWVAYKCKSPFRIYHTNGLLHLLLGSLLEANSDRIRAIDTPANRHVLDVFRLIGWLEEHLQQKVSLQDLSNQISISANHLNHLFKEMTSMSPIQYLSYLRMKQAKKLLLNPELSISEISSSVGIQDPLYFSRLFKKSEGISPSQYRESMMKL